jgi:hypothetical protein
MAIITPYIIIKFSRSTAQTMPLSRVAQFKLRPDDDGLDRLEGTYGYEYYGDVYIELRDEFYRLVDGNIIVKYQEYFDGVAQPQSEIYIPGSTAAIRTNILLQRSTYSGYQPYEAVIIGTEISTPGGYTPPGVCDATIQTIITQKLAGAGNGGGGQITIEATSTYGPLRYKLNDGEYQYYPTFTNLKGGGHIAYIVDANGCTDSRPFTLESTASLLVSDPTINVGNGNTSRWSAAFNPIVFTYQRRDFSISSIYPDPWQQTVIVVNGAISIYNGSTFTEVAKDDLVYINAGAYDGVYTVRSSNTSSCTITINAPYVNSAVTSGFININKLRPYYQVRTQITYEDKLTNKTEVITATHRPNKSGVIKADISNFLQSLLRAKDNSSFTQTNFRDDNLSASYNVSYAEVWQDVATGLETNPPYVNIPQPYYVLYAAAQLGSEHGGNMAAYVPFKMVDGPSKRARWITDFHEPLYTHDYPFDIGFIYSENLAGLPLYCEITPLDINRTPLPDGLQTSYLLNEDRSYLLNEDTSKLVIKRQPVSNQPITQAIAQQIGLNRLRINTEFSSRVHYFNIELKYTDNANQKHTITKAQTIRIDNAADEHSVYLRWIGLTGSWNYYRFTYNQEISLDVQNAVIVKNHILDWANQDTMEDVISKSAGVKMKVMAEDLSVDDINGLQSIKYSPKVQMLISQNPVKWQTVILNTATFAEYETRNGQAPFSITFNLPALNIQTQ